MDNTIMFEFPVVNSKFDTVDFKFSSDLFHTDSASSLTGGEYELLREDVSLSAQVKENDMNGYDFDYNYNFEEGKGDRWRSATLTYSTLDSNLLNKEDNLIINKVEFDRENGNVVAVRMEFQADTEEDVENIKNKAKAYGIKVK